MTSEIDENLFYVGIKRFRSVLSNLNLFSSNPIWTSNLTYREQIESTRLFLLLTFISLLIIIGYSSLKIHTNKIHLEQFSLSDFEKLEKLYSETINVPCNEISIPYSKFLYYSPEFHQICQSDFLKSNYISSLFQMNSTSYNLLDFRRFGYSYFRSLKLLCRISRQGIKDILQRFHSTHFVHGYLYSRKQFNEITSVFFNNLQKNILNNEKRTMKIISMIIAQNRFLSALRTNYVIQSKAGSRMYSTFNVMYYNIDNSTCDCKLSANQCFYPAGIFYNWTSPQLGIPAKDFPPPLYKIPGLMAGCLPLDSIRQSTLECLYDEFCIKMISFQSNNSLPKILNQNLTRYSLNRTIGSIFDESLFVEFWKNETSYENYFNSCSPRSLSYSYRQRFHIGTIITITLTSFAGLILLWELITPIFIQIYKLIKKKRKSQTSSQQTQIESSIINVPTKPINKVVVTHIHRTIANFNLFPITNSKSKEEDEYIGIITTRIYLFLIIISLIILSFYTIITKHEQIRVIKNPSIKQFEELTNLNLSSLNCPCSHFSISYGRLLSLSVDYHSICSSKLIENDWLSYFGNIEIDIELVTFLTTDFRVSGQSFFDLIRLLCKMSNETINDSIKLFQSNRLITLNTLSSKQFSIEMEIHLKQFQDKTISSFIDLIQLIRLLIQTNQLSEELWTNLGPFATFNNQSQQWLFEYRSRNFYENNCSCQYSNQCFRSVGFYYQNDTIRSKTNLIVPGLILSCYPIDSLLLSTFQCFYDENCMKFLMKNYYFDVENLVKPLNQRIYQIKSLENHNSRFYPNTTINEIFSQLFIEKWINQTNFSSYYQRCSPSQCTFIEIKRFDIPYMLTIMLGFYGSLTAILEIILPTFIQMIFKKYFKHKTNLDNSTNVASSPEKAQIIRKKLKSIHSLNLFKSDLSSTNKEFEYEEILLTRIYIILLVISILITIIYNGPLSEIKETITIKSPSLEIVNQLHKQNLIDLSCPCSKFSINYSNILSINPSYNKICSNRSLLLNEMNLTDDKKRYINAQKRLLFELCNFTKSSINNQKKNFLTRKLLSIETLTNSSFVIETNGFISRFISQISSDYSRTLSFIIGSFHVNQLLNLFEKNWKLEFTINENEQDLMKTIPKQFQNSNCFCSISPNCKEYLIDQIFSGCFISDSLRLSKYENISFYSLNQNLFVKQWFNQSFYENYFHLCQPKQCQYTINQKNNLIFILTTLLGLYGGLTYFLQLILGQSLLIYRWWRKKRQERQSKCECISNPSIPSEMKL
ncbi:hypothetical protein I4U23_017324 [Adineta vaga]|nr:hypothetical protein I4U23_017324 [Adineta vaga]